MKTSQITDFRFKKTGYGCYNVTYISPVTGKKSDCTTTDMRLIDATKNSDNPKQNDLETLKKLCKS